MRIRTLSAALFAPVPAVAQPAPLVGGLNVRVIRGTKKLIHDDHEAVQRSLFDYVPDGLNDYEKSVALYLDKHPEVLWWYRNLVGAQCFSILAR
jgi:hypothetical protein